MRQGGLNDLSAFVTVAAERSFTRAAAKLGMSQSSLSRLMMSLEQRLGVRLLSRTTRSVAPTEAGETLLAALRPALQDIDAGLAALGAMREKPSGTVRLTLLKQAAISVLMPVLPGFLAAYPDVRVELNIDTRLTDIVASRFDAGIRYGALVEKDMIAIRVGPSMRAAVVASPAYVAQRGTPRHPRQLAEHRCINYRLATSGGLYAWEFAKAGRRLEVRVDGGLILNDGELVEAAALAGLGIAYLFDDQISKQIAEGRLVRLLEDWCPPREGYYLYHPSRRQPPPALAALIAALRAHSASSPTPETVCR